MKELLLKLVASDRKHLDGALLFLRLFIGGMMLSHGWAKLASFSTLSATFPDPLGVGSTLSLLLILFAEVGCSCLLIFGLMTRLAALPLMFGMLMGFFRYSWCRSFCSERVAFTLSGRVCIFAVGRSRQLFPGRMDPAKDYSPGDCSISAGTSVVPSSSSSTISVRAKSQ